MSNKKMLAGQKNVAISPIHVRIASDIKEILLNLCLDDRRDMTSQVEWLILQEKKRRDHWERMDGMEMPKI